MQNNNNNEAGAAIATLDELIADRTVDPAKTFTFSINLRNGKVLPFEAFPLTDQQELFDSHAQADKHLRRLHDPTRCPPEWEPYKDTEQAVMRMVTLVCHKVRKPRMTIADGLKMARKCGPLIAEVYTNIAEGFDAAAEAEEDALEQTGE